MNQIKENILLIDEKETLERAITALKAVAGIDARITAREARLAGNITVDAIIEIVVEDNTYHYMAEIKRVDRFGTIGLAKNRMAKYPQPGLLVTPRVTVEMAEKCRALDLQFIDTLGNAYLKGPGLFVLITGQRPRDKKEFVLTTNETQQAGTPTALRMVFALLCKPELLNASYREIKQTAQVALGAVGWVFFDLNTRGLALGGHKKGDRRILERKRLIEEWVTNYPIKLRPKLNPRRFRAEDAEWWRKVDITQYGAQWGGEVAAEKLTDYLRPAICTIYMNAGAIKKNLIKLVRDTKLRADDDGDIEILETFWDFASDENRPDIVPPLLVYADLLATTNPRNLETAQMIFEKHIRDTEAQN